MNSVTIHVKKYLVTTLGLQIKIALLWKLRTRLLIAHPKTRNSNKNKFENIRRNLQ